MRRLKQLISVCICLSLLEMPIYTLASEGGFSAGTVDEYVSEETTPGGEEVEETKEEKPKQPSYLEIKEGEISNAQKEKKLLESSLTDVKKIKEQLEASKKDLRGYVFQLDSNLNEIQTKLANITSLITEKEEQIAKAQKQLEESKEAQVLQYDSMKKRIKFMYEKGNSSYLEMILGAKSFGEMLNKLVYIQQLADYDRNKLIEYQELLDTIGEYEEILVSEQEALKTAKEVAESESEAVNDLILAKQDQIKEYSEDIADKEQLIKEYEEDIALQNSTIATLEAAAAAEKKRLASVGQSPTVSYNGGKFAWPAPSYTRISSEYGMRMHPTLNVEKFHNGIDLAAPNGSAILAAYDGNVVGADYNSSMGNYVMIDHGDGLYTIYMHCSSVYVSSGQKVSKGENIAAVGSTGRSTGPHLHFSVRLNGNYVNPMSYL